MEHYESNFKKISSLVAKELGYYVYALCEINEDGSAKPFYIGKGKGNRCLQHLSDGEGGNKKRKIDMLLTKNKLKIDIIRHGLDDKTAKIVEATCIDLLSTDELENKVRGLGVELGRSSLEELQQLYDSEGISISPEHAGLAFNLTKSFKSAMHEIELYEATRGTWFRVPKGPEIKFAYATYHCIVKEVYKIDHWVPAGTQQYYFRDRKFGDERQKNKHEFIGRLASTEIRARYKGKLLKLDRSYGTPFQKVGF